MAFASDSTTAPAFQRGLLPAQPNPVAAFEADFLALISRPWPEFHDQVAKPELPPAPLLSLADVRHGGAGLLKSEECENSRLTEARTLHLRRQLEAAAEHGADLLAALGLPQLVEPGFNCAGVSTVGAALDHAIDLLDALDGDTDLEDDGVSEPWLASPERNPSVPWKAEWRPHFVTRDPQDRQTHWADGSHQDCEAEITDLPHDGDGEDLEHEPAEDWLGSAIGNGDQRHWAQGEAGEREADPTDDVRFYKGPGEREAAFARRDGLRDLARQAKALRRKVRQVGKPYRPSPDTLVPLGPGVMFWSGSF